MLRKELTLTQKDREAMAILKDFLPDHIFDAHMHLYDADFVPAGGKHPAPPFALDLDTYKKEMGPILGNPKEIRCNLIIHPDRSMKNPAAGNLERSDKALICRLEQNPDCVGEIMLRPGQTAQEIEKRLCHPGIRGLKCYHLLADRQDTFNCDIGEYLPEEAWEVANKRKLVITLHLVKERSLADPKNLSYIKEMAKRYPDATLILAHAARAFASWTGVETVAEFAGFDNIWYDFAAVCESPAMLQIIRKIGVEKCMWGSDYPICRMRGKALSVADGFYWVNEEDMERFRSVNFSGGWLVAIENLMAVRQACILADLGEKEVEDIFYNNAARLWK